MSGLCGWFSREPGALPILDMAAPLHNGSGAPPRCAAHSLGAVALAGAALPGLYHEDGLLIAYWGERPDALARLWRSHGAKACAALSGQFAFALLDERRAEALLAVDRCATRPLYYQMVGRTLLFASNSEALARHPGAGREIDPQAIFDYLYLQALPATRTLYSGQRRLAPGERLHLRAGRAERLRYWRMRFTEHALDATPQAGLLDALSCAADACTGTADDSGGAIAVLLGGGAASITLAGLLQRHTGAPLATVAVGFAPGAESALEPASGAARRLGSRHRELLVGARDLVDAVPLLAAAGDGPCGDPAAFTLFAAAQAARADGATHLAGAQGAAQLFGGGRRFGALARPCLYERLPARCASWRSSRSCSAWRRACPACSHACASASSCRWRRCRRVCAARIPCPPTAWTRCSNRPSWNWSTPMRLPHCRKRCGGAPRRAAAPTARSNSNSSSTCPAASCRPLPAPAPPPASIPCTPT